jgi:hypothetical protein
MNFLHLFILAYSIQLVGLIVFAFTNNARLALWFFALSALALLTLLIYYLHTLPTSHP